MTGAYMTWTYGPAGWITDLNEWIKDPAKTNPKYAWDDFLPGVKNSCAWNGKPGGALGSDDAKQWCIPWGFEQNNITYNKAMFDKAGVAIPGNMDEMVAAPPSSPRMSVAASTASACVARAPGRRSIPASCRPMPISTRRT